MCIEWPVQGCTLVMSLKNLRDSPKDIPCPFDQLFWNSTHSVGLSSTTASCLPKLAKDCELSLHSRHGTAMVFGSCCILFRQEVHLPSVYSFRDQRWQTLPHWACHPRSWSSVFHNMCLLPVLQERHWSVWHTCLLCCFTGYSWHNQLHFLTITVELQIRSPSEHRIKSWKCYGRTHDDDFLVS